MKSHPSAAPQLLSTGTCPFKFDVFAIADKFFGLHGVHEGYWYFVLIQLHSLHKKRQLSHIPPTPLTVWEA
jgi:hypothetical protein